jgi:hypothetical protein
VNCQAHCVTVSCLFLLSGDDGANQHVT